MRLSDERVLLLLGILKGQSLHGYQLHEFIERNLSRITEMKKPTAYALLDRMCAAGLVSARTEQEGNRPPRKVYAITPLGESRFQELLRANLEQADRMMFAGDVGLMFLDHLSREEAAAALTHRLRQVEERVAAYQETPPHTHAVGVNLAVEHIVTLLRCERDWLRSAIDRLQR